MFATGAAADPRMALIKGTTEGILLLGPRPAPAPPAPAPAASGGASASATAKAPAAAGSSPSLAERLSKISRFGDPATGASISEVKGRVGSDSVGIPLPTSTPGSK